MNKGLEPKYRFRDGEGRYVAVEILHNLKRILVIGVYAPNGPIFIFVNLKEKLQDLVYDQLVILGDFSGVMDNSKNRSLSRKKRTVGNTEDRPRNDGTGRPLRCMEEME